MELEEVLQRADVWRGGETVPGIPALPTGFTQLDALFPGGGWPRGALTEILLPRPGVGAVSLVLPALARLSQERRWLAWVAPPHLPYAPALSAAGIDLSRSLMIHPRADADGLWAVEQALRSGTCGAVLAWPATGDMRALRRLQLAAEAGQSWGVLFRSEKMADQASPAAVRLHIKPETDGVSLSVLKRRGGWHTGPIHVRLRDSSVMPLNG